MKLQQEIQYRKKYSLLELVFLYWLLGIPFLCVPMGNLIKNSSEVVDIIPDRLNTLY